MAQQKHAHAMNSQQKSKTYNQIRDKIDKVSVEKKKQNKHPQIINIGLDLMKHIINQIYNLSSYRSLFNIAFFRGSLECSSSEVAPDFHKFLWLFDGVVRARF